MSIESSPDVIHTHQLNYKPIQEANCKYRFLKVPLNNVTSSSVTITPTGSQLLEWKLPNAVYNLAQSFITYTESIATNGAGNYTYVLEDTLGLASNIYFGNASGADLMNLNYANKYLKIARKISTPLQDFLTHDEQTSLLYPSNVDTTALFYPVPNQNGATDTVTGNVNFIEPMYVGVGGANAPYTRNRLFKLGAVSESILSVDKDLFIPTDMFLRINAGPGNGYVFYGTASTNPSTGATANAANITLSNLYLYLAVETNQLIIDSVISKVRSNGLTINIPYTTGFRNSASGGIANINIPLSSQYGKKMKQILTTVWNGTETANTCGDCGNCGGRAGSTAGTKIQTYNTFLNNRQLQDNSIDCQYGTLGIPNFNDWRENERHATGSVILNRAVYAKNWFHLDKFYEDNKGSNIPTENRQDGFDMSQGPVLYQLQATTVSGSTWIFYQFASFSRDVVFNSQGFMYV